MLVNTGEIRTQIQAEIDSYLAKAAALQDKLSLCTQIEQLVNQVNDVVGKHENRQQNPVAVLEAKPQSKPAPKLEVKLEPKLETKPEVKLEASIAVAAPAAEQTMQEAPQAAKDATANAAKNPWACMQQGFQAYLAGKLDKALELFREARELNPGGFEKTWATMTSIPVYSSVARDKYFIEGLFHSK